MRTTLNIDSDLLTHAKREAAAQHRTLTAVIEDALRHMFAEDRSATDTGRVSLPVSGEGGVLPGVDLSNSADLLTVMEDRDAPYGR